MPWDAQRILTLAGSLIVIALIVLYRWRRAGRYVESRNELYSEHYEKLGKYASRVREDSRWPGFLSSMRERYQVIDSGESADDETYSVHYCCIWDATGRQYEPGEDEAGVSSVTAYLRRRAKPKYLSFTLDPSGGVTEEKVSGTSWYDMFEKSV